MNSAPMISVKEFPLDHVELLLDYWYNCDAAYLHSLGADITKMPSRDVFRKLLTENISAPYAEKKSYVLLWELDGSPVGHTNVNQIVFGKHAYMHLHLWKPITRKQGLGTALVKKSIPFFFEHLQLENLLCEPYALNEAPNKTLEKIGFVFQKKHTTIPGSLNFEQEVNTWLLSKASFHKWI